ncbi:hypothetical protein D3C83_42860 [compost metagenome]
MCLPNCSGVEPVGVEPSAENRFTTSGDLSASPIAALILRTMGAGTWAPVSTPYHWSTSYPGTPASATVGSSGAAGVRLPVVTASALRRPLGRCGRTPKSVPKPTWTSPASMAGMTAAVPLYGTCVIFVPAM